MTPHSTYESLKTSWYWLWQYQKMKATCFNVVLWKFYHVDAATRRKCTLTLLGGTVSFLFPNILQYELSLSTTIHGDSQTIKSFWIFASSYSTPDQNYEYYFISLNSRSIFRAKKYNVINKQTDTVALFSGH